MRRAGEGCDDAQWGTMVALKRKDEESEESEEEEDDEKQEDDAEKKAKKKSGKQVMHDRFLLSVQDEVDQFFSRLYIP